MMNHHSTFRKSLSAIALTSCMLFPQFCIAQQIEQQIEHQADAAFASYSSEVLSSSRRQKEAPALPTSALELKATTEEPSLLPPPSPFNKAAEAAKFAAPGEFVDGLNTQDLLKKLVAGVVLSASLCFVILFIGSKWMPQRQGVGAKGNLQLLDTLQVGQRCSLQLVQVQNQLVIVGRDASGIREIVPLAANFEARLDDADHARLDQGTLDRETLEFEKAAEALLAQKGVTGWNRTKLQQR